MAKCNQMTSLRFKALSASVNPELVFQFTQIYLLMYFICANGELYSPLRTLTLTLTLTPTLTKLTLTLTILTLVLIRMNNISNLSRRTQHAANCRTVPHYSASVTNLLGYNSLQVNNHWYSQQKVALRTDFVCLSVRPSVSSTRDCNSKMDNRRKFRFNTQRLHSNRNRLCNF